MNKSLLTYYLFALIVICVAIYIFLFVDAKAYDLPKEADIENGHIEIVTEPEMKIKTEKNTQETKEETKEEYVSLGEFKLTAYCPCEKCCGKWANNRPNGIVYGAIGEELKESYSIAVDPDVIPYRTEVIINGKTYKAQDCGGAIKGNRIDVYFEDHNDALEFGIQYEEVFVKM